MVSNVPGGLVPAVALLAVTPCLGGHPRREVQDQLLAREGDPEAGTTAALDAHRILAFQLQSMERYEEADLHFRKLLSAAEPRHVLGAHYQLGRSRVLGGYEAKAAVKHLRVFVESDADRTAGLPSIASGYWRLGMAYELAGNIEEARRSFEEALRRDADNKEAKKALKALPAP